MNGAPGELDWRQVLDLYEAGLAHHQTLVDGEMNDETNPWPPSVLPTTPLPDELRDRAERLLGQSHRLIDDMAGALAAIPPRRTTRHTHRDTPDQPRWKLTL
jgi:hypothetical protein